MGTISRGIKNAFRNGIRSISVIFILAVSISMALVMLMALKTVQDKIENVKSSIGNTITITPAGIRGFEGGGELLTVADANMVTEIADVTKVTKVLSDRLGSGEDTSLQSSVEAGAFGNRQRVRNSGGAEEGRSMPANFSLPINVSATSDFGVLSSLNINQFELTSGSIFDTGSDENVALVGKDLASKNNLGVDSSFQAYNQEIKVAGIFDSGNNFTNSSVIMPIATLQKLSAQADQLSSLIIQASSIDSIKSVEQSIKDKLGDKIDVTSQQDNSSEAIKPLENIKSISFYSLVGALIAGSVIILLTMIMIVRERRREIGILKAIGSSNLGIVSMFMAESLTLTFLSSVLGIILGMFFSNPVLKALASGSETATPNVVGENFGQGARVMMRLGGPIQNTINDLHAAVGWEMILYGLATALAIAIIGSAIPAFFISKISPAEVMRQE